MNFDSAFRDITDLIPRRLSSAMPSASLWSFISVSIQFPIAFAYFSPVYTTIGEATNVNSVNCQLYASTVPSRSTCQKPRMVPARKAEIEFTNWPSEGPRPLIMRLDSYARFCPSSPGFMLSMNSTSCCSKEWMYLSLKRCVMLSEPLFHQFEPCLQNHSDTTFQGRR